MTQIFTIFGLISGKIAKILEILGGRSPPLPPSSTDPDKTTTKTKIFVHFSYVENARSNDLCHHSFKMIMQNTILGTPMQNNLVELMSLLVFVMPDMFANKKEQLKKMFAMFPKSQGEGNRSSYEQERILHAKRIMKPFFLRRLKSEVLGNLPQKTEEVIKVAMTQSQHEAYFKMVAEYKKRAKDVSIFLYSVYKLC